MMNNQMLQGVHELNSMEQAMTSTAFLSPRANNQNQIQSSYATNN
jgi:hypothetical protein